MRLIIPFPADTKLSLEITLQGESITTIDYIFSIPVSHQKKTASHPETQIRDEFSSYFKDPAHEFSLSCELEGATAFQQRVWQALKEIPSGEVKTYAQLAAHLDSSPRAVGNACRANRVPIIIPCHRVIAASGIGGYAGDSQTNQKGNIDYIAIKRWLLKHEKESFK